MPVPLLATDGGSRVPDPLFMLYFNITNEAHPIHNNPHIHPIVRVRVEYPYLDKPTGYISRANNITGVAQTVADWFEYLGYGRGSGWFGTGCYMGAVQLQNLATAAHYNTFGDPTGALLAHPDDGVGTGVYRTASYYSATGIYSLRTRFSVPFLTLLKSELDSRGLCYPWLWNESMEIGHGSAQDFIHATNNVHDGSWTDMINDPRCSTEVLYEERRGNSVTGMTLTGILQAYYGAGNPAPNITGGLYFQGVGQTWTNYFGMAGEMMKDYAIDQAWYSQVKSFFPEAVVCNYGQILVHTTGLIPVTDVANPWSRNVSGLNNAKMDYLAFPCYGPVIVNSFPESARFNVPSSTLGSATGLVYQNFVGARIHAVSGSHRGCIPWFPVPGDMNHTLESFTDQTGVNSYQNRYYYNQSDIIHVMMSGALEAGINKFNIFNTSSSDAVGDSILDMVNTFLVSYKAAKPFRGRTRLRNNVAGI